MFDVDKPTMPDVQPQIYMASHMIHLAIEAACVHAIYAHEREFVVNGYLNEVVL